MPEMRPSWQRWTCVAALWIGANGCVELPDLDGVQIECEDSGDCPSGTVCRESIGRCVEGIFSCVNTLGVLRELEVGFHCLVNATQLAQCLGSQVAQVFMGGLTFEQFVDATHGFFWTGTALGASLT